ncbi:hypothetical protein Tfer_2043 [Thermincola ferriacetica]|uniref:DUF559 domain-containing protein n=1 Tax=Thermincola ferriacetica TaxID=281456 RepID=A0A0L6W2V0_9FIRM|nr:hypothetical protein [Thermincola ferriacetica]KNZ69404.1 hypothetical protein Tfer_2043 [Thermincola ferriacetica]
MPFYKKGTPEYEAWKNSPQYEEYREKMRQSIQKSEKHRQVVQSEEYREKLRQSMLQSVKYRQSREKVRQVIRELWQDEVFRERAYREMVDACTTEEYRERKSQIMQKVGQSREFREKQRQDKLRLWQDPDFARKVLEGLHQQTRPEQLMEQLLNELFPGEYRYVGDGQLTIGGKVPDFANVNGQKKLIEVFGDYWHEGQDPQERIDFFRQYGFDCLVIWESELEDLEEVAEKLRQFHSRI